MLLVAAAEVETKAAAAEVLEVLEKVKFLLIVIQLLH